MSKTYYHIPITLFISIHYTVGRKSRKVQRGVRADFQDHKGRSKAIRFGSRQ